MYTPIGRHLTIIYPKRLPISIIFLPIGDNTGPLGNVRYEVSVQSLCQRTSIYHHARSACHVCTSMQFRFMRQAFRVHLCDLESSFRCTLPRQRDIYVIQIRFTIKQNTVAQRSIEPVTVLRRQSWKLPSKGSGTDRGQS